MLGAPWSASVWTRSRLASSRRRPITVPTSGSATVQPLGVPMYYGGGGGAASSRAATSPGSSPKIPHRSLYGDHHPPPSAASTASERGLRTLERTSYASRKKAKDFLGRWPSWLRPSSRGSTSRSRGRRGCASWARASSSGPPYVDRAAVRHPRGTGTAAQRAVLQGIRRDFDGTGRTVQRDQQGAPGARRVRRRTLTGTSRASGRVRSIA